MVTLMLWHKPDQKSQFQHCPSKYYLTISTLKFNSPLRFRSPREDWPYLKDRERILVRPFLMPVRPFLMPVPPPPPGTLSFRVSYTPKLDGFHTYSLTEQKT